MSTEKIVDCRGFSCPQPVIMTKKAMEEAPEALLIIVDNAVSKENVTKFAVASGYGAKVESDGATFNLHLLKKQTAVAPALAAEGAFPPVYLVTQDTLGNGSEELGGILMKSFFPALQETSPLPKTLLLLNSGVRLAAEGSPVLPALQALAGKGVTIMSCGTCLDYYHLKEKLAVGSITNMFTILTECNGPGRTITL